MARKTPKPIPRRQRRKEAKESVKQRRVAYYTKKPRYGFPTVERKVDAENVCSPQQSQSLSPSLSPIQSILKTRSSNDGGKEGRVDTKKRRLSIGAHETTGKRVRWCPSVVPNQGEQTQSEESVAENEEGLCNSPTVNSRNLTRELGSKLRVAKRSKSGIKPNSHQELNKGIGWKDDPEIGYLEEQLGLKGQAGKKNKTRLMRELVELDGLDSDLLEFTDFCLMDGNVDCKVTDKTGKDKCFDLDNNSDEIDYDSTAESDSDNNTDDDLSNDDLSNDDLSNDDLSNDVLSNDDLSNDDLSNDDADDDGDVNDDDVDDVKTPVGIDDEEIAYLEKQLGIKGSQKAKSKAALVKELTLLDGLDPDIIELAENCLKPGYTKIKKGTKILSDPNVVDQGNESLISEDGDISDDSDSREDDDSDGEDDESCDKYDNEPKLPRSKRMREVTTAGISATETKYVPPALRTKKQKLNETESSVSNTSQATLESRAVSLALAKVEIKITGLVNRVSDGNLSLISAQIGKEIFNGALSLAQQYYDKLLIRKTTKTKMSNPLPTDAAASLLSLLSCKLCQKIVAVSIESLNSTASLIACQAACVAALSALTSFRICQFYIVELVKSFEKNWKIILELLDQSQKFTQENESATGGDELLTQISTFRSYLRFSVTALSLLFDFGLLEASVIFAFVRRLFESLPISSPLRSPTALFETQVDLLLSCLRHAGSRLRSQFSTDFKEICSFLTDITSTFQSSSGRKEGAKPDRLTYLIRELEDLKSGKIAHSTDRLRFIRCWLSEGPEFQGFQWGQLLFSLRSANGTVNSLTNDWHSVAEDLCLPECPMTRYGTYSDAERFEAKARFANNLNYEKEKLLQCADAQRLHTDLQKSIFVALMAAENPQHAVQRLLEVANNKNDASHVVAVAMHTCLRQRVFNPFFAQVIVELCALSSSLQNRYKRATRQGVTAQLTTCHEFPLLNLMNFAKLIVYLCFSLAGEILQLRIIRFLREDAINDKETGLSGKLGIFLRQICIGFCKAEGTSVEEQNVVDKLFENQLRAVSLMDDIRKHLLLVTQSLVIPDLKKQSPDSIPLDKAKLIVEIMSDTSS